MKTEIKNKNLTLQLNIDSEHVINYGLVNSIDFIFYTSDNKTNSIVKDLSHCDKYNYITLLWDELMLLEQGLLKYEYTIYIDEQTIYKDNVKTDYYICTDITDSNEFNRITLNDFYNKSELDIKLNNEYYTKSEVDDKINSNGGFDSTDYYNKTDIDKKLKGYALSSHTHNYLTSVPSEYITESELNAKGYLTQHQSLDGYAKLTDIPTDYIKSIPSEYITESELNSKGYITEQYDDTELSNRLTTLETTVGNIGTIIDSINGEVI